jgi:hypothetical protein
MNLSPELCAVFHQTKFWKIPQQSSPLEFLSISGSIRIFGAFYTSTSAVRSNDDISLEPEPQNYAGLLELWRVHWTKKGEEDSI